MYIFKIVVFFFDLRHFPHALGCVVRCCGIGSLGELGIVCTPHCMWSFLWQLLLLSFTCEDFATNYFVGCFVFNECRSRKHGSAPWVWASGTNLRVVLFDFVKKTLDQRTFTTFFVTIELGGTICTIHTNDAGSHGIGTFGALRYTVCSKKVLNFILPV